MQTGLRLFLALTLSLSGGHALARELAVEEQRVIEKSMADFLGRNNVSIRWTPFVEDLGQNPISRRIYCATVEDRGKQLPFMAQVVEEINYRIVSVRIEYVFDARARDFTAKLNNSTTLQYCRESGYAVGAP
jgi:hypothetical protein